MKYVVELNNGEKPVRGISFSMHRGFPVKGYGVFEDSVTKERECFGTDVMRRGVDAYGVAFAEDMYRGLGVVLDKKRAMLHECVSMFDMRDKVADWRAGDKCSVWNNRSFGLVVNGTDSFTVEVADRVIRLYGKSASVCYVAFPGREEIKLMSLFDVMLELSKICGVNLFGYRTVHFHSDYSALASVVFKGTPEAQRFLLKVRVSEGL